MEAAKRKADREFLADKNSSRQDVDICSPNEKINNQIKKDL